MPSSRAFPSRLISDNALQMYIVRNGEVTQNIIQLESPAVGLARLNKDVMV